MSPKRTRAETVRERFLDLWLRREGFGEPIGCAATSYTFDAPFFEEDCLGRFVGMESQPDEDGTVYVVEREEKLAQVTCVALVDVGHVPQSRSLRWHLLPVRVPDGGILHAKVNLLAWDRHVRVTVGSANLTEYGYRRNIEHMGVLDSTPQGGMPKALLARALQFLEGVAALAPGATSGAADGPQAALRDLLGNVRRLTSDWPDEPVGRGPSVSWLTTLPAEDGVFGQLRGRHWRGTGPDQVEVLSPFYDEGDRARQQLRGLLELLGKRGTRSIVFRGRGREAPDGRTHLEMPEAIREPLADGITHGFEYIPEQDEESQVRPLHAKSMWLQREDRAAFMIGSSNFTCAGYGTAGGPRNVEANLVYDLPSLRDRYARQCMDCGPDGYEAAGAVAFLEEIRDQTPDPQGFVPLPAGFGEALFEPRGEGGMLRLELGGDLPAQFVVSAEGEEELLAREIWEAEGRPDWVVRAWPHARPPSSLIVTWWSAADEPLRSLWVVNVTDTAGLPAPDELRNLTLEELVEILTSARPLHEALRLVKRRLEGAGGLSAAEVFDPHRRVDTRNYLLRRVRRISGALEGLRQRLERPAYDMDALRWRLHGPIGPVALARRLADEEGEGAGFMIAEVAMTLKVADWSRVESALGPDAVRAEVAGVISRLRKLATERHGPANLAAYVAETFARVEP